MYIPNDTDAVKNFYEVHLRKTKTFEDPLRVYQLDALANSLSGFGITVLINTSTGADIDTANSLYECSAASGNIAIDLADIDAPLTGNEVLGDILIFKVTNTNVGVGDYTVTITDDNSLATILDTVNDVIVFKYSTKWEFYFMAHDGNTANQEDYFTEVGILDEGPMINTEKGDSRMTSKGYELYAKKISFEANDLQVNEANSDYYRSVVESGNVDIMFYNPDDTDHSTFLLDFPLESFLNIKGNSWNTIPFSGSKEVAKSSVSNYIKLFKDNTV